MEKHSQLIDPATGHGMLTNDIDDWYYSASAKAILGAAGVGKRRDASAPPSEMLTVTKEVNYFRIKSFYRRLCRTWAHGAIGDKLWESICPQGIDLVYRVAETPLSPDDAVLEEINDVWAPQVCALFQSMVSVGYGTMIYGKKDEEDAIMTPRTLGPDEYSLQFSVDRNGVRRYVPRPRDTLAVLCLVDETGMPAFENYDVFFWKEPTHDGMWRSKSLTAYPYLIMLDQLMLDFRLITHERINTPLVVQQRESPYGATRKYGSEPRVNPTGRAAEFGAPRQDENLNPAAARQALGMYTFTMNAITAADSKLRQTMTQQTVARANESTAVMGFEYGDPETGLTHSVAPDLMRQRSFFALPTNSEVATAQQPDLPIEYAKNLLMTISFISSTFGLPPEVILGAATGRNASSALSQEQLRVTVLKWRYELQKCMRRMYWKIFGDSHSFLLADAAGKNKVVLSSRDANDAKARRTKLEFSFRSDPLDPEKARGLWKEGMLRRPGYGNFVMGEYGISKTDLVLDEEEAAKIAAKLQTRPPAAAAPPKKKLRAAAPEDEKEKKKTREEKKEKKKNKSLAKV
jgi:hypothetical protein